MLKIMRQGAIENPWLYRTVMGSIAAAFIVSMGWWGFDNQAGDAVAHVNDAAIPRDEYQRAYRNASDLYRQIFKEKYDDKALRKQVIDELVAQRLWLKEAERLHVRVPDVELKAALSKMSAFQKDGVFTAEQYHRVLQNNRIRPETFEQQQREQILVERVKERVKDGVALNKTEADDAKKSNEADPDRGIADALFSKKQRAMTAYNLALKKAAVVKIKEDLL